MLGRLDRRQPGGDPLDSDPRQMADRGRRQQVGDVVAAEQAGRDLGALVADHQRERGPPVGQRDLLGADLGVV